MKEFAVHVSNNTKPVGGFKVGCQIAKYISALRTAYKYVSVTKWVFNFNGSYESIGAFTRAQQQETDCFR